MSFRPPGIELDRALDADGQSWKGVQTATGQPVVLRLLPPDAPVDRLRERLERLLQLQLPRVLLPLDAVWDGSPGYLVFPYFPVSLSAARAGVGHSPEQVRRWLEQIVETLRITESYGLEHGALQAGNLLLDRESGLRIDGWLISRGNGQPSQRQLGQLGHWLLGGQSGAAGRRLERVLAGAERGEYASLGELQEELEESGRVRISRRPPGVWPGALLLAGLLFDLRLFFLLVLGAVTGALVGVWQGSAGHRWRRRRDR